MPWVSLVPPVIPSVVLVRALGPCLAVSLSVSGLLGLPIFAPALCSAGSHRSEATALNSPPLVFATSSTTMPQSQSLLSGNTTMVLKHAPLENNV